MKCKVNSFIVVCFGFILFWLILIDNSTTVLGETYIKPETNIEETGITGEIETIETKNEIDGTQIETILTKIREEVDKGTENETIGEELIKQGLYLGIPSELLLIELSIDSEDDIDTVDDADNSNEDSNSSSDSNGNNNSNSSNNNENDIEQDNDGNYDKETETEVQENNAPTLVSLGTYKLTAYCPCSICCGEWSGGLTASGTTPTQGRTVGCNSIPAGTVIYINGHEYVVEDTGNMANNVIDVYMDSHQAALEFGVQYAEVFVYQ